MCAGTGSGGDASDDDASSTRRQYDWTTDQPSTAIVETIAAASDREPTDIPPLFTTIDPDALDSLVPFSDSRQDGDVSVSFRLDEFEVTVQRDGVVAVASLSSSDETDR